MAMIIFNGKTYNNMEEMSANERQAYEQIANMLVDKNGNGIPDFLEGDMAKNVMTAFTSSMNINGQTYNSMDELPPDIRAKVQGAFEKLSTLGIVTKVLPTTAQIGQNPTTASQPLISREYNPSIQEDKSNPMMWLMIGMILMMCLGMAAIGIFFLLK
jgi:hypothetical protein